MQAPERKSITIKNIGIQPYKKVWDYQKELQRKLVEGLAPETLIVCEHPPVITLGTSAKPENVILEKSKLADLGIEVYKTERGGDVTCHMPGQIVLYPILDLHLHKTDVAWYMRSLEEAIIRTLEIYDIKGTRIAGKTGVWVPDDNKTGFSKIASIGVRISRWRTMHGLALNIKDCTEIFKYINPCGYKDIEISEMQRMTEINLDKNEVTNNLIKCLLAVFNFDEQIEDNSFETEQL